MPKLPKNNADKSKQTWTTTTTTDYLFIINTEQKKKQMKTTTKNIYKSLAKITRPS